MTHNFSVFIRSVSRSWGPALGVLLSLVLLPGTGLAQDPNTQEPIIELSFRDFFRLPVGPGGVEFSERLARANGRQVRLTGYMVQRETATPGQFLLTPRPVQMSEHADGDANDLPPATVLVRLDPTQTDWAVPHVRGLVGVTGVLRVGRREEADNQVFWVGLELGPDATRSMTVFDMASYLHQQQHRH
ncbi:MAG: hypothetical protein EBT05_08855 [Betaproteobacteria bacterium]|nr:hypothetical protein [Betaproteobacteria bacterium]